MTPPVMTFRPWQFAPPPFPAHLFCASCALFPSLPSFPLLSSLLTLGPPLFPFALSPFPCSALVFLWGLVCSPPFLVIPLPPAVCPPGSWVVVQHVFVVCCKSPSRWHCVVLMVLTLVSLVQLFCSVCFLSRLVWVGTAASVVGRGCRCQVYNAWHQRLRPCVGISFYTMWSTLVPPPRDSAGMVLHFMHPMAPPP